MDYPQTQNEEDINDEESQYNPNSIERICCVELENNNKILISYMENWTIRDLIKNIIKTKEFQQLYSQRNKILNSQYHLHLFDLHLCLFEDFKPDYENKIAYNIKIDDLHSLGLIKNYNFPFFTFKQNKMPLSFIYNSLKFNDLIKKVIDNDNNYFYFYSIYLPRNNCLNQLNSNPELEDYFRNNKKGYNEFSRFKSNSLIGKNDFDWFIYDNESMKFLLKMNRINIPVGSSLEEINGHLYYEDKVEKIKNINQIKKDISKIFVNLTFDLPQKRVSKKLAINTQTTSLDLIKTVARSINALNKNISFEPEKKILKVRGLNDYIFDINEPLINFTYIIECVTESKNAEYLIIDNPKLNQENISMINETIIQDEQYNFEELLNVAKYIPKLENKFFEEGNEDDILSKSIKTIERNNNENDLLDNFIDSMINDLNENHNINSLNVTNDENDNTLKNDLPNYNIQTFEYENSTIKNSSFLSLNNRKKGRNRHREKNIYLNQKDIDMKKIYQIFDKNISIKDIDKPFSILVKNIFLNSIEIIPNLTILFKFGIYCGNQLYGKINQIKWNIYSTSNINPMLNKRIYFDVNYNTLPTFCSILFKIKYIEYDKNNEIKNNMTKFWGNFRLFDHNKKLRTGQHKINLFDRLFGEDSYYSYIDNFKNNSCPIVFFEIESFSNPIYNEVKYIANNLPTNYNIDAKELEKINIISKKNPFDYLSNYDKEIIWNNRYFVAKMSSLVPKLLLCFNLNDPKYLIELDKIFQLSQKEMTVIKSIELLSGFYLHEKIRNFAVNCLRKAPILEIKNHLLQLFQGLKYEMNHDNELAKFLIEKAVNYPISIGHSFFWYLKSEIFNQDFQHRFGLYLEIFLNKIGKQFSKIFIDEDFLLRKLICAAKIVQNKEISKEIQMKKFKETLEILNQKLKEKKQSISLPLDFKYRVKQIKVEKCKVMKSKKKPLWLVFKNSDPNGDDIIVMFKKGDDLRMDMVTLQIFKEMQNLWYNNGLFLKMSLYKVICTGNNEGMLEMVTDSDTLANIHKQEGGAINTFFSKVSLSNWIKKNCKLISVEEYTNNFLVSCVAYCVATFVLGIGDRHNDNIMIKKNGEIFHIDFGHFLGHVKYKMGIKREWAPFVFTSQFQNVLGGEGGKNYILFKKLLWEAFNVLRKNCENLITLLRILLITGIPELNEKTIKFLGKSLDLKEHDDEEAKKFLNKKLNDSLYSVSTKVNFAIHIVAN
jgi:hypothetical protein